MQEYRFWEIVYLLKQNCIDYDGACCKCPFYSRSIGSCILNAGDGYSPCDWDEIVLRGVAVGNKEASENG